MVDQTGYREPYDFDGTMGDHKGRKKQVQKKKISKRAEPGRVNGQDKEEKEITIGGNWNETNKKQIKHKI